MECKEKATKAAKGYLSRINRNIMECKDSSQIHSHCHDVVLIETLWNVKTYVSISIHTWDKCINRNIMECKEEWGWHFIAVKELY